HAIKRKIKETETKQTSLILLTVGAALNVDVLKYDEETLSALLRVPSRGLVKLWSSLTLQGSYKNQTCAFRVLQVSPFLLALTGNSRDLRLD
uniref:Ribonuclease P/MRP subunit p14 n=1 Tax=Fundulus heteroclitus TaxID=8078 RepID=A0A3Q2QJE8_FUNHE